MFAKKLQNLLLTFFDPHGNVAGMRYFSDPGRIQRLLFVYLALLLCYLLAVKLATPIFKTDTDMWYHMNGGRMLWSTGQVPHTTFFSFIEPVREWINYFWGFQATIFKVYDLFGYQGLVVFRAVMFVLIVGAVLMFIFSERRVRERPWLFLILATLLIMILEARSTGIRPHLFSYLFIAVFIHILQNRPRLAPMLPLLAMLWVNVHGVEWVIGALICGAYFIEHVHTRWGRDGKWGGLDIRFVASVLACAIALLINPFGLEVIASSFAHDPDIYLFITELLGVNPDVFYSFTFSLLQLNLPTSVTILVAVEVLGSLMLLVRGRMRISHAIMAIGGAYLLSKGVRFVWEWSLLTLPLVHAVLVEYEFSIKKTRQLILTRLLVVVYFAAIPFVTLASTFDRYPHYPFDQKGLPVAAAAFLKQNNAKGNILAHPVTSGYLEWALYPDMLIYSDMEFPPFRSVDLYKALWSELNTYVLGRMLGSYDIDFLAVDLSKKDFPKIAADHKRFVPVFFDDTVVLYANRDTQAQLVERYEIKDINPFNLLDKGVPDERKIEILKRIAELEPDGQRVNYALIQTLFDMKRYRDALTYAERFEALYPEDPNSHYWVGNILENLDRCSEAASHFKAAISYAGNESEFAIKIKKHLGTCAYLQKDFDTAYYWFSQSMNPYRQQENSSDMYQYAYATAIAGDSMEAVKLLDLLLLKLDPENESLRAEAQKFRNDILNNELSNIGVVSWLRSLVE